jgi:hypothetical protein
LEEQEQIQEYRRRLVDEARVLCLRFQELNLVLQDDDIDVFK